MNKFKEAKNMMSTGEGFRALKAKQVAQEISNKEEAEKQARLQASTLRIAAAEAAKNSF